MSAAGLDLELAYQDLVAGIETSNVRPRIPAVQDGEFVLLAGFRDSPLVTSRDRSRKLVHFEHTALSVWRQTLDGPVLVRVSVWTLCHQWIKFAKRSQWYAYYEICDRCAHALREAGRQVPVPAVDF